MPKDIDENSIIQRFVLHEGCVLQPYKCPAGYLTIGVGRNLETNPLTKEEQKVCGDYMHGITKNAAYYLLRNDIEKVKRECSKNIPFFNTLDAERRYALLDMCFNLGIKSLLKFRLMLEAMGVGNFEKAAAECLNSRYAKQTGKRAKRIAETIRTGKFRV
jgi:lysozyme